MVLSGGRVATELSLKYATIPLPLKVRYNLSAALALIEQHVYVCWRKGRDAKLMRGRSRARTVGPLAMPKCGQMPPISTSP